jgi:hypothetical protein
LLVTVDAVRILMESSLAAEKARIHHLSSISPASLHHISITSPSPLHRLSITSSTAESMITGIAHVNLIVPPGTLHLADAFYGETLGMHRAPVPPRQKDMLAW